MNLITFFVSLAFASAVVEGAFTYRIIQRGGSEVNPLIEWMMKVKSPLVALVVSRVALMALIVWQPPAAYFLGPVFAGAAVYNFNQWRRMVRPEG